MALKKLLADLSIISKLGINPGIDDGLSEEQLKAKFDEAANIIKDYLNNYLILEIEKTVDVESLLSDILDVTLSKVDKAANAAATGDAIRGLRSFFEKVVHGGNYVLDAGDRLSAEVVASPTVLIHHGTGVMCGNLFSLDEQEVRLNDGAYGLSRNDLIVARCTKDKNNILSYDLISLTGNPTSGDPVDPEYIQSDINTDGTVLDFPLYRAQFQGLDIISLTPLFDVQPTLDEYIRAQAQHTAVTVTLSEAAWEGKYQTIYNIPGVTASNTVIVTPEPASHDAYGAAGVYCHAQGDGALAFTCGEAPTTDLNVNILILK